MGDRAESGVADVAGDDEGRDGHGGQTGCGDVERWCPQVGEADVAVGAVAVLAVLVEHRPQPRADQREEGVDCDRRAAGGHRLLDAWPQLAHEVAAGVGVEAEQRRFAEHHAAQQMAVAASNVEGDDGAAARSDQQARSELEGPMSAAASSAWRATLIGGVAAVAAGVAAAVVAHAVVTVREPVGLVGPHLGVAAHAVHEQHRRALAAALVVEGGVVDVDGRHGGPPRLDQSPATSVRPTGTVGQSGVHPMPSGHDDSRPCSMANSVAPARVVTPALA